jgi:phage repressor protein C with HTH and peptisase S24 domain/DNA-binding XRE family transcriptional regulator
MEKIGKRFVNIRNAYNISQLKMAKMLEIKQPTLSQIENDTIQPSLSILKKIINNFNINYDYIIDGIGNIDKQDVLHTLKHTLVHTLVENQNETTQIKYANEISDLGDLLGDNMGDLPNIQFKPTQINPPFPDISQTQTQSGAKPFKSYPKPAKEFKGIPLIGIEAMAGIGKGEFSVLEQDLTYYNIPELSRANFIIKVSGSSMYPKYSSGDLLACIYVKDTTFIQFGKVYVMDTGQGAVVKRLFKSQEPNHYLCQSDNPEYPSFDISLESIRALALVIGVIRFE